jgi:hypothetical protein
MAQMSGSPPRVRIDHDDYHAKHVGRASRGEQSFLNGPFVPAVRANPGREFIAVYLFDGAGALIEARANRESSRAPRASTPPTVSVRRITS